MAMAMVNPPAKFLCVLEKVVGTCRIFHDTPLGLSQATTCLHQLAAEYRRRECTNDQLRELCILRVDSGENVWGDSFPRWLIVRDAYALDLV